LHDRRISECRHSNYTCTDHQDGFIIYSGSIWIFAHLGIAVMRQLSKVTQTFLTSISRLRVLIAGMMIHLPLHWQWYFVKNVSPAFSLACCCQESPAARGQDKCLSFYVHWSVKSSCDRSLKHVVGSAKIGASEGKDERMKYFLWHQASDIAEFSLSSCCHCPIRMKRGSIYRIWWSSGRLMRVCQQNDICLLRIALKIAVTSRIPGNATAVKRWVFFCCFVNGMPISST